MNRSCANISLICLALVFPAAAQQPAETALPPPTTLRDAADVLGIVLPTSVSQGAMVIGKVPAGSAVRSAIFLRISP